MAEFCQIFRLFFGQWNFKKYCFWYLLTFKYITLDWYQKFHESHCVIWWQIKCAINKDKFLPSWLQWVKIPSKVPLHRNATSKLIQLPTGGFWWTFGVPWCKWKGKISRSRLIRTDWMHRYGSFYQSGSIWWLDTGKARTIKVFKF